MAILIALAGVFAVLALSELLWRTKRIRGESARKLVHISVGTFVAFWPYFMSWHQIQLMSLAFLVVVVISQQRNIFHAIHSVKRRTWGEIWFAIGIGLAALLAPPAIVFTAAILHLSLADGLAAIIGQKYGLLHQYKIHHYTKTLAGTLTFYAISTLIVVATVIAGPGLSITVLPLIVWLPMLATLSENIGVGGVDNILVPIVVILAMRVAGIS